jgi:hypothetical protein
MGTTAVETVPDAVDSAADAVDTVADAVESASDPVEIGPSATVSRYVGMVALDASVAM